MVPALGNTMWVEKAPPLSAPCSHIAWPGFFEALLQLHRTITSNLLVLRSPGWFLLPGLSRRVGKALSPGHLLRDGWPVTEPGTNPCEGPGCEHL